MSTLVLFEAKLKPGLSERAAQTMAEQLPDTRRFEGCQGILCYRERQGGNIIDFVSEGLEGEAAAAAAKGNDDDDGDYLVLVEYWDSLAAYHKYVMWRTSTGDLPDFADMCARPPVLRTFDLMDM